MENKEKKTIEVQANVDFGKEAFFSNGLNVSHNQDNFYLDFRHAVLRNSEGGARVMHVKHNMVMINANFVKTIIEVMQNQIEEHKKNFGKIKQVGKVRKASDVTEATPEKADYYG